MHMMITALPTHMQLDLAAQAGDQNIHRPSDKIGGPFASQAWEYSIVVMSIEASMASRFILHWALLSLLGGKSVRYYAQEKIWMTLHTDNGLIFHAWFPIRFK